MATQKQLKKINDLESDDIDARWIFTIHIDNINWLSVGFIQYDRKVGYLFLLKSWRWGITQFEID